VEKQQCKDAAGSRMISPEWGYSAKSNKHDERGKLVETTTLDKRDRPMFSKRGYAIERTRYDLQGNETEIAYFGPRGRSVVRPDEGYHKKTYGYDEFGYQNEVRFFIAPDTPVASTAHKKDGSEFVSVTRSVRNVRKKVEKESYFDGQDRPIKHPESGCEEKRYKWQDSTGDKLEERCTDATGGLLATPWKWARQSFAYDKRGRERELVYYAADGSEVALKNQPWSKRQQEWDALGNLVGKIYFAPDGSAIADEVNGCIQIRREYDNRKNRLKSSCQDQGGGLVMGRKGWARIKNVYDEQDNKVEQAFFDADDHSVVITEGFAKVKYTYNDRNKVTGFVYLGTDDLPIADKRGLSRCLQEYDDNGRLVRTGYSGLEGQPVNGENGWAIRVVSFDEAGKELSDVYFDAKGNTLDSRLVQRNTRLREQGLQNDD
jgi:YD repeat-containing protein